MSIFFDIAEYLLVYLIGFMGGTAATLLIRPKPKSPNRDGYSRSHDKYGER